MIYVTGDIHADMDRFKSKAIKRLKKNDTLIVCGDFGFVWDGSPKEQKQLKWLGKRHFNLLFIEGTHDNLELLAQYPEVEYCGGKARQISGRCHQLLRGEIYNMESDQLFVFGGGESFDMDTRVSGETWWANELPTQEEIAYARENLEKHGNVVDYIVTHQASSIVNSFLNMDSIHTNQLAAFFDEISQKVRYKHWFFGCYHTDKVIPPKHHIVYQEVLPLKAQL
ncbi:metallophosphoesterase family protein [Oscillospiraceae bacterium PP1C4]